jgi:hypothetical protein
MRNYSKEHQDRMKHKKRLVVEIERTQAQKFEAILKDHDITFSNWVKNQINEFMKEA